MSRMSIVISKLGGVSGPVSHSRSAGSGRELGPEGLEQFLRPKMVMIAPTAVWIDLLRGTETAAVSRLRRLLDEGRAVTTPVVVQELLQGASNPASLQRLHEHFLSLPMVEPLPGGLTYAAAGGLYVRCRWQGVTPRSPHDCLIAQTAIDHGLPLLHDDRDFGALAQVDPRLQLMDA